MTVLKPVNKFLFNKPYAALHVYASPVICLLVMMTVLTGCSSLLKRDHYDVPDVPLPAQFKNSPAPITSAAKPDLINSSDAANPAANGLDPLLVEWWHVFGNAELDSLINRGLSNNPDVRIATFKIVQAKVRAEQASSGKGPTLTAPLGFTMGAPYYGVGGPQTNGLNANGPKGQSVKKLFQASIRGDWRPDLWGELSSIAESSNLQLWRASFERDNEERNAAANIASSYIEYLSLNDRIRVARETEKVLTGMVATVQDRMEVGDATAIDLEQQRSAVFAIRATIPSLEQQRDDALGTIAFLLGTVSASLKLSDQGLDSLFLTTIIPGMPSNLLLRRPDVRMVEAGLLAADADIDVARARVLPPLDLSLQAGYGSYYLSELFKPQALFWNAISNLSITIFDGGKLSKEKEYAEAVHEQMVETYVRTIYQAVREVESALNAIRQSDKRLEAQKESADSSRRAWNFNSEVYASGAIDYKVLLDSEREYHQSLDEYHRIRMDRYRALVSLFNALGGGVPVSETLPGKGVRPVMAESKAGFALTEANNIVKAPDGDWLDNPSYENEDAWLVELPGLYHRNSIDAAWVDLQARFPEWIKDRSMRRYLQTGTEPATNKKLALYQLYIAKFSSAAAAEKLCADLRSVQQRCKVVLSQKGKIAALTQTTSSQEKNIPVASAPAIKQIPISDGATIEAAKKEIPNSKTTGQAQPALPHDAVKAKTETANKSIKPDEQTSANVERVPAVEYRSSLPEWSMPDLSLPEISMPDVSWPDWSIPEWSLPDFSFPELALPDWSLPDWMIPGGDE
jgi:NodT family efflux transporter outer membrane factor (OMF) lipoprotein